MGQIVDFPEGQSASDPCFILDQQTGELLLFFNYMDHDQAPGEYRFMVTSSKDHGKSWTEPRDITDEICPPEWKSDFKFITSGRGWQTSKGYLVHTLVNLEKGMHVFQSMDHGASWQLLPTPITPGDESKIVELGTGEWLISSRVNGAGIRYTHRSVNQGWTWVSEADSSLVDPGCNGSLLFDKQNDLLYFSNPASTTTRENLTLKVSRDGGRSWEVQKEIYPGSAAYSSMTLLQDGSIGVFFEADNYGRSIFLRVTR